MIERQLCPASLELDIYFLGGAAYTVFKASFTSCGVVVFHFSHIVSGSLQRFQRSFASRGVIASYLITPCQRQRTACSRLLYRL